jgi:hypothetical protein
MLARRIVVGIVSVQVRHLLHQAEYFHHTLTLAERIITL